MVGLGGVRGTAILSWGDAALAGVWLDHGADTADARAARCWSLLQVDGPYGQTL